MSRITMTSSDSKTKNGSVELKSVLVKKEQLLETSQVLVSSEELRSRVDFKHSEVRSSNRPDRVNFKEKLNCLLKTKAIPPQCPKETMNAKEDNEENSISPVEDNFAEIPISDQIFFVEPPPPPFPAPTVILDIDKFPTSPCKTQCPECRQFITTETFTSTSSVTWMVCCMSAIIGCVAGCCLIPFCMNTFKSVTHRCPKCRTSISTIKKL